MPFSVDERRSVLDGISVIIPCHNAAQRLPQTLAHIAAQQVSPELRWEVILIDNASTDNTSQVALHAWPANAPAPLRAVLEPRLGANYARERGFAEAKYEIITFVEDDNWIAPDWLTLVVEVMDQHPEIGACGGLNEAVCEINPPDWFERYAYCYAIGPQGKEPGDITWTRGYLFGAGLTVRKAAWHQLVQEGFRLRLPDRQGAQTNTINSGGDVEICSALRLSGWQLWYEPGLKLRHFLMGHRLNWDYLRRLNRGFGAKSVGLDPYRLILHNHPNVLKGRLGRIWITQALAPIVFLFRKLRKVIQSRSNSLEGDVDAILVEHQLGRLSELLRQRNTYDQAFYDIWNASWRKKP